MQHALVQQLPERFDKRHQPRIIQYFGPKSRVQQVHNRVLGSADVGIYRQPFGHRLGIKRAESYEGLFGKLKPTRETATARIYRYDVPAARVSVIEDLVTPAMKKHFSAVSSGGARLGRVRKAQFKRGVRATCITMPTGPLMVEYRHPTALKARRNGAIGKLKIGPLL